ncbi:MAG: type II toxin-antitoxin system HicB family antitoxin [Candidatus Binatia bacterium]
MRLAGRMSRVGRWWAVEVPMLGVATQGSTRKEALAMIADAVQELVNRKGVRIRVHSGDGDGFEISANDPAALTALMLRRLRARAGLTLAEVAVRLDARSLNAWARYEQGRAVPTIVKLSELFAAVAPGRDFVITESRRSS